MKFWASIVAFFVAVAAFLTGRRGIKQGERNKLKVKDHENADDIRDRVRDATNGVSKHDDAGWRD